MNGSPAPQITQTGRVFANSGISIGCLPTFFEARYSLSTARLCPQSAYFITRSKNASGIGFGLILLSARFIPHLVVVSCESSPRIGVCQILAKPCHLYPSSTPQLIRVTLATRVGCPDAQRRPHGPPKSCRTRCARGTDN